MPRKTQFSLKMENAVFILLLLCALSSAKDSEELEERSRPYPTALHAELRDMRVELAKNTLKIQQLQTDKQELEAKVKELAERDTQLKPLQEQLEVSRVAFFATLREFGGEYVGKYSSPTIVIFRHVVLNIGDVYSPDTGFFTAPVKGAYRFDFTIFGHLDNSHFLGAVLRKNGKDITSTFTRQSSGSASISSGATLLLEAKNIVTVYLSVRQIAFSASLLTSGSGYTGPFNAHTPLVFRNVISNIGNAYNPNTGYFIAPVRGAYHFEFYIAGLGNSENSGAALVKNGEHVVVAYETEAKNWGQSANAATLFLEVNDVVSLRLWINARIYENENRHNTFSGRLLFTV